MGEVFTQPGPITDSQYLSAYDNVAVIAFTGKSPLWLAHIQVLYAFRRALVSCGLNFLNLSPDKKPRSHAAFAAHFDDAALLKFETVLEEYMGRQSNLNLPNLAGRFHA
jgi:hypothetical protein